VFDGEPEGDPADTVDDDVEVAAELLDDTPGAQAAQQLPGRGGIADQRGDDSAAARASWTAMRPTPPVAPVTSTRLPSTRPPTSSARSAVRPAVGRVAACASDTGPGG
jgi:hypothetical protein